MAHTTMIHHSSEDSDPPAYNVFRDSPLRFAGYANEVGESFRYQFPKLVTPSYVVAFGYCLADAVTTGWSTWDHLQKKSCQAESETIRETLVATADTLLWQCLASVLLPGATINGIVRMSRFAVMQSPMQFSPVIKSWAPTFIGLGSIPFIVSPIDSAVDFMLEETTRKWWTVYRQR